MRPPRGVGRPQLEICVSHRHEGALRPIFSACLPDFTTEKDWFRDILNVWKAVVFKKFPSLLVLFWDIKNQVLRQIQFCFAHVCVSIHKCVMQCNACILYQYLCKNIYIYTHIYIHISIYVVTRALHCNTHIF